MRCHKLTHRHRIDQTSNPITDESNTGKFRRRYKYTRKCKQGTLGPKIYCTFENQETPFEFHFGREPRAKMSNLQHVISVDHSYFLIYAVSILLIQIRNTHARRCSDYRVNSDAFYALHTCCSRQGLHLRARFNVHTRKFGIWYQRF